MSYDSSMFNFEFTEYGCFDEPIINNDDNPTWESFKHHSSTSLEAKYWLGYYCYHDKEIPKLQQINRRLRIKT
ncbi:hypothetical protein RhiirA5_430755 [Rhizophagus irregularis]|nr:hypothetical protein RhiirA5_430755 [Rhizophagus irregularis]